MKKKLFLLLIVLLGESLFAGVCRYCKKEHFKEYICLPKAHAYFLNGGMNSLMSECYIYHIGRFFELEGVNSLDKFKVVSKVFYTYYRSKNGDNIKINVNSRDPLAVKTLLFLNNFVETKDEMILFHGAIWVYSNLKLNL